MLEITKKNYSKCNLETIIGNNSQHFWINLRDFGVETESKWPNIFNKHGNKLTLQYRRELTPNIKCQADRIFVRNDLFEQVVKSCKATNAEFLMFKENLGIFLYEENCYEEEIIQIQDEEPIEEILKVSNEKSTKELTKESTKELTNKLYENSDEGSIFEFSKNQTMNWIEESTKKLTKELIKESDKKSSEESVNQSNKNSIERLEEC